jgi:hypothetical protein
MPLSLKTVEPSRGLRWIADALRLFAKRPLGLMAFFGLFLLWMLLVGIVPYLGMALQLASLPMLSLGFMIASQSALLDGPVQARQYLDPLRTDLPRRSALIKLCVSFAVICMFMLWLANWMSGDGLGHFLEFTRQGEPKQAQMEALLADESVGNFFWYFSLMMSALSVPYWHATALVHWGGQTASHAVFSSTLALWRNKGAFAVYCVGWLGLSLMTSVLSSLVIAALGFPLGALPVLGLLLACSALFYVSLLFIFNDSFGGTPVQTDDDPATQPDL